MFRLVLSVSRPTRPSEKAMAGHLKYLRQTLGNIKRTMRITFAKEVYVGSDEYGNKYYERPAGN